MKRKETRGRPRNIDKPELKRINIRMSQEIYIFIADRAAKNGRSFAAESMELLKMVINHIKSSNAIIAKS